MEMMMTNEKLHWNKTNYSVNQFFEKPQTKDFKIHSINFKSHVCVFSTIGCLAFSCEKYMSLAESALKSLQLGGRRKSKQKLS